MPKTNSSKDSGFKKFIKENKSMAFMLPLLAILIIVVVVVYSGMGKPKVSSADNSQTPTPESITTPVSDQPSVEVLPQTQRETQDEPSDVEPLKDPFETPMKLSGVLLYSNNDATAIIESGGVSYIVRKDETIGDTTWKVFGINSNSVMLDSNGKSMLLQLSNTESTAQ